MTMYTPQQFLKRLRRRVGPVEMKKIEARYRKEARKINKRIKLANQIPRVARKICTA